MCKGRRVICHCAGTGWRLAVRESHYRRFEFLNDNGLQSMSCLSRSAPQLVVLGYWQSWKVARRWRRLPSSTSKLWQLDILRSFYTSRSGVKVRCDLSGKWYFNNQSLKN